MFGYQFKGPFPCSDLFYRHFGIQHKTAVLWNQNAQAFPDIAAGNHKPVNNVSRQSTAALKVIIKSLSLYQNLARLFSAYRNRKLTLQKIASCLTLCGRRIFYSHGSVSAGQTKTDGDRVINHGHLPLIQMAHMLPETPFVNGPDLFQKNDGVFA